MDYRSQFSLLGLPLLHVTTGELRAGRYERGIARAWIAVGDVSFGVLLSVGGVAFGGIAIGGIGLGVISLSGMAIGVLALAGMAVGVFALGGMAIGWKAAMGGDGDRL